MRASIAAELSSMRNDVGLMQQSVGLISVAMTNMVSGEHPGMLDIFTLTEKLTTGRLSDSATPPPVAIWSTKYWGSDLHLGSLSWPNSECQDHYLY